jgi:hypothetical protein
VLIGPFGIFLTFARFLPVPPLGFVDIVALGAGEPVDGALVLGAVDGSDIVVGAGAGVVIVPVGGGVGAVIGTTDGGAVWAAAPAGARPSAAAASSGRNVVFIVRVTW